MNEGRIKVSINKIRKLLLELDLLKDYKIYNCNELDFTKKYSSEYAEIKFTDDYLLLYRTIMKHGDYDILLFDDSFLQFSYEKKTKKIRYQYFPNPYENMNYEKFLEEHFEGIDVSDSSYFLEYEQYIDENTNIKYNKTYSIRYDYDENEYKRYIHPISHLHIGLNNSTRIPVNYVITPQLFVFVVCMFLYHDKWKKIATDDNLINEYKKLKNNALEIKKDLLTNDEKGIIFIN